MPRIPKTTTYDDKIIQDVSIYALLNKCSFNDIVENALKTYLKLVKVYDDMSLQREFLTKDELMLYKFLSKYVTFIIKK